MGVRQSLNENKKLGVGVGAGIVVVALAIISFQLFGGGSNVIEAPSSAFYTDDNGKTFFTDDINKVVPFDHNGKQAYRADVFQCPDGKQFVCVIYRHTAAGRQQMEEYLSRKGMEQDKDGSFRQGIEYRGMDVKRAGANDKAWIPNDEQTAESLRKSVKCPSGGPAQLVVP